MDRRSFVKSITALGGSAALPLDALGNLSDAAARKLMNHTDDFQMQIIGACAVKPAFGSFRQDVMLQDGTRQTHRFSLAVGFEYLSRKQRYRNRFGSANPPWVDLEHPQIASQLFELALNAQRLLPDCRPGSSCHAVRIL